MLTQKRDFAFAIFPQDLILSEKRKRNFILIGINDSKLDIFVEEIFTPTEPKSIKKGTFQEKDIKRTCHVKLDVIKRDKIIHTSKTATKLKMETVPCRTDVNVQSR